MKKNYTNVDFEMMDFEIQDVLTLSNVSAFSEDQEDGGSFGDLFF